MCFIVWKLGTNMKATQYWCHPSILLVFCCRFSLRIIDYKVRDRSLKCLRKRLQSCLILSRYTKTIARKHYHFPRIIVFFLVRSLGESQDVSHSDTWTRQVSGCWTGARKCTGIQIIDRKNKSQCLVGRGGVSGVEHMLLPAIRLCGEWASCNAT